MDPRIIVLFLFFIIGFSCYPQTSSDKQKEPFVEIYTGTIDNAFSVHVLLYFEDERVSGSYFFNGVGKNIGLYGTITKDGFINLTERNHKGIETGLWKGTSSSEKGIIGIWTKPDGTSASEFKLAPTKNPFDNKTKEITEADYFRYSGTYNSPFNDGGVSYGKVKIEYIGNGELFFDIMTTRIPTCIGNADGVAKILSPGLAFFSGEGCDGLTFIFHGNEVKIKENNCMLHGIACFFTGSYIKEK